MNDFNHDGQQKQSSVMHHIYITQRTSCRQRYQKNGGIHGTAAREWLVIEFPHLEHRNNNASEFPGRL